MLKGETNFFESGKITGLEYIFKVKLHMAFPDMKNMSNKLI